MNPLHSLAAGLLLGAALLSSGPAHAHGSQVGDIAIDHPYALPTAPGAHSGTAQVRALRNTGTQPDRLLGARTPVAERVEIVRDGRVLDAIALPAGAELKQMRHDGNTQLRLVNLKAPLKDGDQFPLTLRFERAGETELMFTVQTPKARGAASAAH